MARELADRDVHAEADPQVGDALLAGVARRLDLALETAAAEAAGDEDAVGVRRAAAAAPPPVSASESTQSISTRHPWRKPAWRSASATER